MIDLPLPAGTTLLLRGGRVLTPDAEIRQLAGIEIGAPFTPDTLALVVARLKATHRTRGGWSSAR